MEKKCERSLVQLSPYSRRKDVTCYSPVSPFSSANNLKKKNRNVQRTFPTLLRPAGVRVNHITLCFNEMIAGFTFWGENKHLVKKFHVLVVMQKKVKFTGPNYSRKKKLISLIFDAGLNQSMISELNLIFPIFTLMLET